MSDLIGSDKNIYNTYNKDTDDMKKTTVWIERIYYSFWSGV